MKFVVLALATWRISHMLVNERGPYDILTLLRVQCGFEYDLDFNKLSAPDNHVLSCVWCVSVWVGGVLVLLPSWLSVPFALSAVTVLVEENGPS